MAAVFERQAIIHTQSMQSLDMNIYRSLVIREKPFDFYSSLDRRPFYLDERFLDTAQTDWLYNALDEITLNSALPLWTHNEWAFTPVDLRSLPNITVSQKTRWKGKVQDALNPSTSSTNITITTSALRSRLECSIIPHPISGWLDRVEDVFPNKINETITGYVLPAILFEDEPYKTPVFTVPRRMACCTNGTIPGRQSIIAYWSSNSSIAESQAEEPVDANGPEDLREPSAWYQNFTIKWIVGPTASTLVSIGNYTAFGGIGSADEKLLYFTEEPRMTIMNCIPVIEQANANITLAFNTGQVSVSTILGKPQPAHKAWDYPYNIMYPKPYYNESEGNVRYV
jgi:hypothetical protein